MFHCYWPLHCSHTRFFPNRLITSPFRGAFFSPIKKSFDTSSSLRDAPRFMPRSAGRVDTSCGCRVAGRIAWHVSAWTVWLVITRVITFCGYQLWLSRGGSHCYFYNVTFFLVMLPQCYLFLGQKVTIQKVSKRAVSWQCMTRHVRKMAFFILFLINNL